MDRRPYTEWEEKGDGARDWAREKIKKILATHKPEPLDPKLEAELQRIIQDKVNDCGSHHFGRQEHSLMANGAPGGNDDRQLCQKKPVYGAQVVYTGNVRA